MTFVKACPADKIPDEGLLAVDVVCAEETLPLMIGKTDGRTVVYLNICPHQGRKLNYAPNQFLHRDGQVICAAHGATFELENGMCVAGPCLGSPLCKLEWEISDGVLSVRKP